MSGRRPKNLPAALALLLWLALPLPGRAAQEGTVSAERPAEYMIYQYPGTTLVLRIDVPEAEFSERTLGRENALIGSSSVPGRRLGPVYQFVDAVELPRQLIVEVTPGRAIERADITLELLQFSAGDRSVAAVTRAYRLFSLGTETAYSDDTSTWASKTYSLRNAAGIFASLGMEEMRLWSEYFSAHLVLHQLEDPVMALEWIGEVIGGAARAGFEQVELAARVLESDVLLRLAAGSDERSARGYHEKAHDALAEVAALAQQLGLDVERSRALFQDGRVYEMQGEPERALDRYREAMEISALASDADLLNHVRATAAAVYESIGSTSGAIEMLDSIAENLTRAQQQDSELELADRLFEKGRLLNSNYRFAEAATELSRALELLRAGAGKRPWGPTGLELAWSHYSLGDMDEALRLLEISLPRTAAEGNAAAMTRAHGSLANIYRERRRFDLAAQARESQGALTGGGPGRAAYLVEAAMDARMRDGPSSAQAQSLLQQARQAAVQENDRLNASRASLHLCLLQWENGQGAACGDPTASASFENLQRSGVPAAAAEASLVKSRILRRSGRVREAGDAMDRLIEDLYWYRRALPGVLGAWYAENRDAITREYLSLAQVADSGSTGRSGDGSSLLLAMQRVRMLEAADFPRPGARLLEPEKEESLRGLLARRAAAAGEEAQRLAVEANGLLGSARQAAGSAGDMMSAGDLDRLLAGLGRNEAVLSYYFAGSDSQVLVARRGKVQAIALPGAEYIQERLDLLRDSLARAPSSTLRDDLDSLGQAMLQPVAQVVPAKVYLLPAGPLRGIPFDALRLRGKYFAEDHLVVNLSSLSSAGRGAPAMPGSWRERVFLAGNPQQPGDPFSLEFRVSPEIASVTDQFVGPGLHIVQGVALRKHEFSDDRLGSAGLIHLAMPGMLDLAFPDRSRLQLASGAEEDTAGSAAFLAPPDIRAFRLASPLVVLSGSTVVGHGQSPADSRLAVVADFLEAGAAAVLVSVWPADEKVNADFATDLYGRLKSDPDIERAFSETRRARIRAEVQTNLDSWAGFQLFIR